MAHTHEGGAEGYSRSGDEAGAEMREEKLENIHRQQ